MFKLNSEGEASNSSTLLLLMVVLAFSLVNEAASARSKYKRETSADSSTAPETNELFQKSLHLLRLNKFDEARKDLEKAAALEPDSASIHCNLGLCLEELGEIENAKSEFNKAIRLEPGMPSAMINLAACYQSQSDYLQAINCYRRFIKENPKSPEVVQAQDLIAELSKILSTQKQQPADPSSADYFEALQTRRCWPAQQLPMRVFIQSGDPDHGYRDCFAAYMKEALDEWKEAIGERFSFVIVETPEQANLICLWTDNLEVSSGGSMAERGAARVIPAENSPWKATIVVLVSPKFEGGTVRDDLIKKTCLHEIGHVLGLGGHSNNAQDIMFFTIDSTLVNNKLTERDKNTIARLYRIGS